LSLCCVGCWIVVFTRKWITFPLIKKLDSKWFCHVRVTMWESVKCVYMSRLIIVSLSHFSPRIYMGSEFAKASHSLFFASSLELLVDNTVHCPSVHDDLLQIQNLISVKVWSLNQKAIPKPLQAALSTVTQSSRLFPPTQRSF
jgi:hypothetical protein